MRLHLIFRVACAMCFIGHGAFGIITKQVWCNYFAVFGIGESTAYALMPYIGIADIIFGIMFIVYPIRAVAGWLVFWGFFTALLRPLSGESFAQLIERAGNFGAPLALLLLSEKSGWFKIMKPSVLNEDQEKRLMWCLRVIGFLLLLGHGWLNKNQVIGAIEMAAALMILVKPVRQLVLIFFVWKMVSEMFYPAWPVFEWVERGGSYAILLGLWLAMKQVSSSRQASSTDLFASPQPVAKPSAHP